MTDATLAHLDVQLEAAFARPEVFRPLLDPREGADVPWRADIARTKRFLEYWSADADFRRALAEDAPAAAARVGLDLDAEELRALWDVAFSDQVRQGGVWRAPISVQQYQLWNAEKLQYRERLRRDWCAPQDPRHRAWRQRQINRTLSHLGQGSYDSIVHAPFAIELTEGCSVGCWFCGVSAGRKQADFLYTEANRRLWIETLAVLRDRIGPAAGHGFLYWATDPLDNPDYEKFGLDFAHICGRFPQTTTAQPQKHVERVRALLKLSAEHGCEINRFSVLSLSVFKKILEAFTAEELLHCELVLQNREAVTVQSNSGRARGHGELEKRAEIHNREASWRETPGTISCVSGYLINMVRRTVKLITPCPSSESWPDGHWILEQGSFGDGDDFAALIDGMMKRHMPIALSAGAGVRPRRDIRLVASRDQIRFESVGGSISLDGRPNLARLAQAVAAGTRTAGEIAIDMEDRFGWPAAEAMSALNWLFDQGLLDEEPVSETVVVHPAALRRVPQEIPS